MLLWRFNSRLREEATASETGSESGGGCFNSRLREEATSDVMAYLLIVMAFQLTPP